MCWLILDYPQAIIAGLTNESIHRLKVTIWNKLPRASMSTFTYLSSIVDDVNNQTLLRHTQLFIEGTSKVSFEESFGTVPYLGTFLTDITMINTRYQNYIKVSKGHCVMTNPSHRITLLDGQWKKAYQL